MANLRANRITSTEVFETTGSVQFDGSGDYLQIVRGSDTAYALGTDDFTIEMWIYRISAGAIISTADNGDYDRGGFALEETGNFTIAEASGSVFQQFIDAVDINVFNTWVHYAFVRKDNVFSSYEDGKLRVQEPTNINITYDDTNDLSIGARRTGSSGALRAYSNFFEGHISNVRILKGTALYTENFTPPTRELEVIPNTVLLCAQSTTNAAEEKTGKTITVNGDAVANELTPGLLTNVVKSGGSSAITGSVEFDGTGDYLSLAASDDWYLDGDFTLECWFYPTSTPSNSNYGTIIGQWESGGGTDRNVLIYYLTDGSGNTSLSSALQTSSTQLLGSLSISNANSFNNSWHHTALVVSNNQYMFFVDGIKISTSTVTGTTNNSTIKWMIGASDNGSGVGEFIFKGFISNARLIKGTALYTSDFIPPTRKLTKLPGTVLLCCQDSNDPTTEATGKTITVNGDPTASDFTPSVGSDGSVEFTGPTTINTENYFYLPTGPTEQRGRGRGLFGGGTAPPNINTIQYINIQSTGNAIDFGDLTLARRGLASCSSVTRGIWGGGTGGTPDTFRNIIDYITISSTGDAQDFGDLTDALRQKTALSNSNRGVFAGGYNPLSSNVIEYITITSTGNAIDFGDLSSNKSAMLSCSSPVRGIFAGGGPVTNVIEYITISSTGNAVDFGDLITVRAYTGGCSSSTRGIFGAGFISPGVTNSIEYITISSTGNSQDFGDVTVSRFDLNALSASTKGFFGGGYTPTILNIIDYVTIASTGNASDFGDLLASTTQLAGCSDSHGGLG